MATIGFDKEHPEGLRGEMENWEGWEHTERKEKGKQKREGRVKQNYKRGMNTSDPFLIPEG